MGVAAGRGAGGTVREFWGVAYTWRYEAVEKAGGREPGSPCSPARFSSSSSSSMLLYEQQHVASAAAKGSMLA